MNSQAPRCQWMAYIGVVSGSHAVPDDSRAICGSWPSGSWAGAAFERCSAVGSGDGDCARIGTACSPAIDTTAITPAKRESATRMYMDLSRKRTTTCSREPGLDSKPGCGTDWSWRTVPAYPLGRGQYLRQQRCARSHRHNGFDDGC